MPDDRVRPGEIEGSHGATGATPRWGVFLPLGVVVAALIALLVVPLLIAGQTRALRAELIELYDPLASRVSSLERVTGTELSAARAWALTGDPFFVDRFLSVHDYGNQLATDIDRLAGRLGGQAEAAASELLETREFWAAANFGRTRADFREGVAEHQQHFDDVMLASQRLQEALDRDVAIQNERIARSERIRGRLTAFLAIVALLGAASAIWLGRRLLRKEEELKAAAAELSDVNESLEERVRDRTRRVRQLSRDLTLAEQHERRQLAELLHDDLQQLLFALQLNVDSLQSRLDELPRNALRQQLAESRSVIDEAITITRRLTVDLSPPIQAGDTLIEVLEWLAAHVQERFGLRVELHSAGVPPRLPEDLHVLLFQTVREMLFNVVKHADTAEAALEVSTRNGELVVEVVDRGTGFDPVAAEPTRRRTAGGLGLRAAHERLGLFGGRLEVESQPGEGTCARVVVPVEQLEPGAAVEEPRSV